MFFFFFIFFYFVRHFAAPRVKLFFFNFYHIWMLFVFLAKQYHGIYYLSFQVDEQEHGIHL